MSIGEIRLLAEEVTIDSTPSDVSGNTRIRITNANAVATGQINVAVSYTHLRAHET